MQEDDTELFVRFTQYWVKFFTLPFTVITGSILLVFSDFLIVMLSDTMKVSSKSSGLSSDIPEIRSSARSKNRHSSKPIRSLSLTMAIEFPERTTKMPVYYSSSTSTWKDQQDRVKGCTERYRTLSYNFVEKYRAPDNELILSKANGLAMLQKMPSTFPLQSLPQELKLKIFSCLTSKERGIAAQVCKEWSHLMIVPSLWSNIDFTEIPFCVRCSEKSVECSMLCYTAYRARIKRFFWYLVSVRPAMRYLKFEFDIDRDGWLELLQALLRSAYCQELSVAYLNWKETPGRPQSTDSHTWSSSDYNDIMFHHRHRQRLFVKFLDFVVTAAPNIKILTLPFDWSDRSIRAIGRLRNIHTLVLQSYFWSQWIEQSSLSLLLQVTPNLKKLVLEVLSHSVHGLTPYVFESESLEHLDISASRGIYISRIDLPKLITIHTTRQPVSSPLVTLDSPKLPCVYRVLCNGAPNLLCINNLVLSKDWTENTYRELEEIMSIVCSCQRHKDFKDFV